MAKTEQTDSESNSDFNLKHRITGAAVLIFFGVLVLPALLGPPSGTDTSQDANAANQQAELTNTTSQQELIETDLLADEVEPEETVYISRITPLDQQNSQSQAKPKATASAAKADPPKSVEKSEDKAAEPSKTSVAKNEVVKEDSAASEVPKADKADKSESTETAKASASASKPETATDQQSELIAKTGQSKPKPATVVAANDAAVDVGWVVQVGLFSTTGYQTRATKLVNELNQKGFKADSTIVDTNKGKGMRVWLGPFAKRAQASNEVQRLKVETGKDGFVRVYP